VLALVRALTLVLLLATAARQARPAWLRTRQRAGRAAAGAPQYADSDQRRLKQRRVLAFMGL
jgi:hypothetical protein